MENFGATILGIYIYLGIFFAIYSTYREYKKVKNKKNIDGNMIGVYFVSCVFFWMPYLIILGVREMNKRWDDSEDDNNKFGLV